MISYDFLGKSDDLGGFLHLRGSVSLLSVFQDGILMNHRPGIIVPNKARLPICFNASILFLGLEWADSMDDMDVDSWECQLPAVPTGPVLEELFCFVHGPAPAGLRR